MEETRQQIAERAKAEDEVVRLKLGDGWNMEAAGNGRIRLRHESGLDVYGNQLCLYSIVRNGVPQKSGLTLDEARQEVEKSAVEVVSTRPEPVLPDLHEYILVEDDVKVAPKIKSKPKGKKVAGKRPSKRKPKAK